MASKGARGLNEAMRSLSLSTQAAWTCREAAAKIAPSATFTRSMATETALPSYTTSASQFTPVTHVPVTIYGFPSYEPQRLESWSAKHLHLPLRRDLLHRAVVFEGDNTRQGTASSKTRYEVHGSNRKLRQQKGSGRARIGNRKAPHLKGGGKSFGPHPRDFGTKLPRKVYDQAWRIALSWRYRRGELIVCEDGMDLPLPPQFQLLSDAGHLDKPELRNGFIDKWTRQVLDTNEWGRSAARSTFITTDPRDSLFTALDNLPRYGTAIDVAHVDVKDLLETGRLVVERSALHEMLEQHQSDLITSVYINRPSPRTPVSGDIIVE